MKIEQKKWTQAKGWQMISDKQLESPASLVLIFGGRSVVEDPAHFTHIKTWYPEANIIMCSTAGEIIGREVLDDSLSLTAIVWEKTALHFSETSIEKSEDSAIAGERLARALPKDKLAHVIVFSDGLVVNGTALVGGLLKNLPPSVSVTGGLVGDGANFKKTVVGLNEVPKSGQIVLIGLYGDDIRIGYGSLGGWDPFGPERKITKAKANLLYELDGQPALTLYKKYLGDLAKDLPGSGLLFPLSLRLKNANGDEVDVVRTLLAVDEKEQSMTFAGDMPEGVYAKLMKANFDRLVEGASGAASMSLESLGEGKAELALLISCIGRKLVLRERVEEEIEAVIERVGEYAAITGFYSYGEICPTAATQKQCQLHNQTMTITTLREN